MRDARVDPSAVDDYAIRTAAKSGHAALVEVLIRDARVNPAASDDRALGLAAYDGYEDVIALFMRDTRVSRCTHVEDLVREFVEVKSRILVETH
jgi:hypothetical protein